MTNPLPRPPLRTVAPPPAGIEPADAVGTAADALGLPYRIDGILARMPRQLASRIASAVRYRAELGTPHPAAAEVAAAIRSYFLETEE